MRQNAAEMDDMHTNKVDPNLRTNFGKHDGTANDIGEGKLEGWVINTIVRK